MQCKQESVRITSQLTIEGGIVHAESALFFVILIQSWQHSRCSKRAGVKILKNFSMTENSFLMYKL